MGSKQLVLDTSSPPRVFAFADGGTEQVAIPRGYVRAATQGTASGIAVSPDGQYLAVASDFVWVYDLYTMLVVAKLSTNGEFALSCDFSPDGQYLAVGDWTAVRVFNTATWTQITSITGRSGNIVLFTADGSTLLNGCNSNSPSQPNGRAFEVGTWAAISGHIMTTRRSIVDMKLSADGTRLVGVCYLNPRIIHFDLVNNLDLSDLDLPIWSFFTSCDISPDNQLIAISAQTYTDPYYKLTLWDSLDMSAPIAITGVSDIHGGGACRFSEDGSVLYAGRAISQDGPMDIVDMSTLTLSTIPDLTVRARQIVRVPARPDEVTGRLQFAGGGECEGRVQVFSRHAPLYLGGGPVSGDWAVPRTQPGPYLVVVRADAAGESAEPAVSAADWVEVQA